MTINATVNNSKLIFRSATMTVSDVYNFGNATWNYDKKIKQYRIYSVIRQKFILPKYCKYVNYSYEIQF